jgi:4a-hydroxytetrahydrobiopterin dehydratase
MGPKNQMNDLYLKECQLYPPGTLAFEQSQIDLYLPSISSKWIVLSHPRRLQRRFVCRNYQQVFDYCTKTYLLAQEQNHHPKLQLTYRMFEIEIWTHSVSGLQESDFIFAAKIDRMLNDE